MPSLGIEQICMREVQDLALPADKVQKLIDDGHQIRTTLVICTYGNEIILNAHTNERCTHVLGALELAKCIAIESYSAGPHNPDE